MAMTGKMLRANMKVSLEPMVEPQILELVINLLPREFGAWSRSVAYEIAR